MTKTIHEGEALRSKLKASPITMNEISEILGMTRQNLSYHLRKEVLDGDFRRLIKEKLQTENKFSIMSDAQAYYQSRIDGTPIYDIEATAGNLELSSHIPETIKGYINMPSFRECIAFLYVRGDSMYPKLKAGDLIGVIPVTDLNIIQYGQVYLVITKDNQRMVKYVRKGKNDNSLVLRSENEKYDDLELQRSKLEKLYMVKGPIRDDWQ
jgi:phage repressor protein C with HTH and peptisase S24 domain